MDKALCNWPLIHTLTRSHADGDMWHAGLPIGSNLISVSWPRKLQHVALGNWTANQEMMDDPLYRRTHRRLTLTHMTHWLVWVSGVDGWGRKVFFGTSADVMTSFGLICTYFIQLMSSAPGIHPAYVAAPWCCYCIVSSQSIVTNMDSSWQLLFTIQLSSLQVVSIGCSKWLKTKSSESSKIAIFDLKKNKQIKCVIMQKHQEEIGSLLCCLSPLPLSSVHGDVKQPLSYPEQTNKHAYANYNIKWAHCFTICLSLNSGHIITV